MSESIEVDVAVIGAGPAGIAAAVRASERGARVAIVEQGAAPGGQIWRGSALPRAARSWIGRLRATPPSRITFLARAEVVDGTAADGLLLATDAGAARLRARATIIATGARELLLPFPGWTLPNVMGAAGLQALVKSGLAVRSRRVVIAGSGPLLLPVARALAHAGARLALVAEQATPRALRAFAASLWRTPSRLATAAALRASFLAVPYRAGCWIARADGDDHVREVTLTDGTRRWREPCEFAGCAYGLVPNTEIGQLLGCAVGRAGIAVDELQATTVPGVFAAGECTGIGGAPLALVEGEIAGLSATGASAAPAALAVRRDRERIFAARVAAAFAPRAEVLALAQPDTVICRCEDVLFDALEGLGESRAARLHARVGMGACQGRVCGAALEAMRGWDAGAARPPVFPVSVGLLADDGAPPS